MANPQPFMDLCELTIHDQVLREPIVTTPPARMTAGPAHVLGPAGA